MMMNVVLECAVDHVCVYATHIKQPSHTCVCVCMHGCQTSYTLKTNGNLHSENERCMCTG